MCGMKIRKIMCGILFFLAGGGLFYSVAWVWQDVRYGIRISKMHMRARNISTLVFGTMLPAFEDSLDKKRKADFFSECEYAVPNYIMIDTLQEKQAYEKWHGKWTEVLEPLKNE